MLILIFIDSNIPMYLVGGAHPHNADAQLLLERSIAAGERLVTDAEVLQEILHRYTAIGRREAIGPARKVDVLRAVEIAQRREKFSARDAIHYRNHAAHES